MLKTHGLKRLMTVDSNMKVEEVHNDGDHEDMDAKLQEAWDDVSGAALDPKSNILACLLVYLFLLQEGHSAEFVDVLLRS